MRSSSTGGHRGGATGPAGSNMNDAGYPFRGHYKLDKKLNHGHSGITREIPTSMMMKITGTNLVISQVTVPQTLSLACELGVGNEKAKLIHFPVDRALEVPADRREYNLTAIVSSGNSKHYSKLLLQSDGGGGGSFSAPSVGPFFLRLSSNLGPDGEDFLNPGGSKQPKPNVYFICGRDVVRPADDGSFSIPVDPSTVQPGGNTTTPYHLIVEEPLRPLPPFPDTPQFITIECDPTGTFTGDMRVGNRLVLDDANDGTLTDAPYIIDSEGNRHRCFPDRRSVVTIPTPKSGTIVFKIPKAKSVAPPPPPPPQLPEISTDISPMIDPSTNSIASTLFTTVAVGCEIQLSVAGYETVKGYGQASIAVSPVLSHKVHMTVTPMGSLAPALSQTSTIPRLSLSSSIVDPIPQPPAEPIVLKLSEQIEGLGAGPNPRRRTVVSTAAAPGVEISADGRPTPSISGQPQLSVVLDPVTSHFVDIVNKNANTSARLHLDARPSAIDEPQWVWDLARELEDPTTSGAGGGSPAAAADGHGGTGGGRNRPDEQLANILKAINPQTPNGSKVISYILSKLNGQQPRFSFDLKKDGSGITAIRCDGYGISFAKGVDRLCHIQHGDEVNFSENAPLKLVASDKNSGTKKAEIVIAGYVKPSPPPPDTNAGDAKFLEALNAALDPYCRYPDTDPRAGNLLSAEIGRIPAVTGVFGPLCKPKLVQLAKDWSAAGGGIAFLLRLIAELNKISDKPITNELIRYHMTVVMTELRPKLNETEVLLLDTLSRLFSAASATPLLPPMRVRIARNGGVSVSLQADGVTLPMAVNNHESVDVDVPRDCRLANIACTATTAPYENNNNDLRPFIRRLIEGYNKFPLLPAQERDLLFTDWASVPTSPMDDIDSTLKRILLRLVAPVVTDGIPPPPPSSSSNGYPLIGYKVNAAGTGLEAVVFGDGERSSPEAGITSASSSSMQIPFPNPRHTMWAECEGKQYIIAQNGVVPPIDEQRHMVEALGRGPRYVKLSLKDTSTAKTLSEIVVNLSGGSGGGGAGGTSRPNIETTITGNGDTTSVRVSVMNPYRVSVRLADEVYGGVGAGSTALNNGGGGGLTALELVYGRSNANPSSSSSPAFNPFVSDNLAYQNGIIGSGGGADPSAVIPSQSVTRRLDCSRSHSLIVSIYDSKGTVIGEDKLTVPRLGASPLHLDYRDGVLSYKPIPNTVVTMRLDGAGERTLSHHAVPLDVDAPHSITLSQFNSDQRGARGAETGLSLPVFIAKEDLVRIIGIYQAYSVRSPASVAPALAELKKTARNKVTRDLIDALIANGGGGGNNGANRESCDGCGCSCPCRYGAQCSASASVCLKKKKPNGGAEAKDDKLIFFRLRGEEEKRAKAAAAAGVNPLQPQSQQQQYSATTILNNTTSYPTTATYHTSNNASGILHMANGGAGGAQRSVNYR